MTDEKAPGGYICRVSPDGKTWDLVSMGFRNPFDIAFNRDGELFTYDSDMEWDVNTPVVPAHPRAATSTSGVRVRLPQRLRQVARLLPSTACRPVVDVGPGSPTGIVFGYGAQVPGEVPRALYICDWSYGKLYAVHLEPKGATYRGELEEFVAGTPLALTDVVVNPADGAMYFAVGGRNTQSGLYRVTYDGPEPTAAAVAGRAAGDVRGPRRCGTSWSGSTATRDPKAVEAAWPYLGHPDRFVRWAARVAIECRTRRSGASGRSPRRPSPEATLNALLALTHVSAQDPAHRRPGDPAPDPALRDRILAALDRIDWDQLDQGRPARPPARLPGRPQSLRPPGRRDRRPG